VEGRCGQLFTGSSIQITVVAVVRQFSTGQTVTLTRTYTPHAIGAAGTFTLTVYDGGEPGAIDGDFIHIDVSSGEYAGYSNASFLQEATYKPDKSESQN
jgi:hypothetical protein